MEIAVQIANPSLLKEALDSSCNTLRFGSEFCMYALPTSDSLKKAYELAASSGKKFVYVTPRLADGPLEKVREHLILINGLGGASVVVNDLGTLRVIKGLSKLNPQLGRQLIYTPSRSPWKEITEQMVNLFTKRNVKRIFYQTALNYGPTIDFFKGLGVIGADIDWIPDCFDSLDFLTKNKLKISVHLHLIPAALTRKCHMARLLGEEDLDRCSRPCYSEAYSMENEFLNTSLFLHGNAVFRLTEPDGKEIGRLAKHGISDLVITMSPLTGITSKAQIDDLIRTLRP